MDNFRQEWLRTQLHWDDKEKSLIYEVLEPELSKEEKEKLEKISSSLLEIIDVGLGIAREPDDIMLPLLAVTSQIDSLDLGLPTIEERFQELGFYTRRLDDPVLIHVYDLATVYIDAKCCTTTYML